MGDAIYVVSVYSNFNGELISEIVHGNCMYDAFMKCDLTRDWIEDAPLPTPFLSGSDEKDLELLKQYMFDNDMAVNIIRID